VRRRLYLMRHGEVAYFVDGVPVRPETVPLTAAGREQAEAARHALAGIDFDFVLTSDLPRTQETARLVAPGSKPETWPDLTEWRGGRLLEVPEDELEQAFVGALHTAEEEAQFLGGETLGSVWDRVIPAIERLLERDWDTALAVLHGGVNRAILSYALTGGRTYLGRFEQAPACINVLDVGPDDWIVRTVNYIPYEPLHPSRATTMEQLWVQFRDFRGV
jgi:broad specificity phosphatase PhoE